MSKQEAYCIVCGADGTDWSVVKHAIPTCPERRAKWLSILGIDPKTVRSRHRVCERHFAKDQYIRTKLNPNAVPKPPTEKCLQGGTRRINPVMIRNPSTESNKKGIWQDKINLNGRCLFCLEMVSKNSKTSLPPTITLNSQLTSLEHLWPYLQANGPPTKNNCQDFYIGKRDSDGELIFSHIPPMCSSCLHNVDNLNTLHHQLEALRAKLIEQEKLVKEAAGIICETVVKSVKPKRKILLNELADSRMPLPCLLNTTQFLDSLLGNPLREYESTRVLPTPIAPQAVPPPPVTPQQLIVLTPVSGLLANPTNLSTLNKLPIPAKPKHCAPNVVSLEPPTTQTEPQEKFGASIIFNDDNVNVKTEPLESEPNELSVESVEFHNRDARKKLKKAATTDHRSCKPVKQRKAGCSDERSPVKHANSDDEELIDVPTYQDFSYNVDNNVGASFDDPLADT